MTRLLGDIPNPRPRFVYDPAGGRDACGVALVGRPDGRRSHELVERSLATLVNLEHRGAAGADGATGDGAGILLQLPAEFLRELAAREDLAEKIPMEGRLAVGVFFLPQDETRRAELEDLVDRALTDHGQRLLGWRDVPVNESAAGEIARRAVPRIRQAFVAAGPDVTGTEDFERRLFVARRAIELRAGEDLSIPSLSSRTIVYKGMLAATQLADFYPDLTERSLTSALAVVHSRFSTNTFPSWGLAQPFRFSAHNGEINTLQGNANWMRARESTLSSPLIGPELADCLPLIPPGVSDSAALDCVLELLVQAGRPIPHAMMMMIPAAHESGRPDLTEELRGFYEYHDRLMEPWDGPAAVAFSDGRIVGATLDRNGLRPARWQMTDDGWVTLASEAGAFESDPARVTRRGRLTPGALLVIDTERREVLLNGAAEAEVAARRPYGQWARERSIELADLPAAGEPEAPRDPLLTRQLAFGWSQEDLRVLIAPMARDAKEPSGSMGNDTALAVFSERQPSLFAYFKQRFAQVTNPPIDPARESIVMSLRMGIGAGGTLLDKKPEEAKRILLDGPVLRDEELQRLRSFDQDGFRSRTLDATWPLDAGPDGLAEALARLQQAASEAVAEDVNVIVVSDRAMGPDRVPIPSLLALSTVHQHLVREGTRLRCGLVVESGEPREIHHLAALIGYGASAVNPYLMLESIGDLHGRAELPDGMEVEEATQRVVTAIGKGLLKTLSRMGISTLASYCGAQIFEAVGLDRQLVDEHFTGTASRIGGVGLGIVAGEAIERHARAYPREHGRHLPAHVENSGLARAHADLLPQGGIYAWRRDGERHMWDPATIASLQRAARSEGEQALESYEEMSRRVDEENAAHGMLRGLLRFREAPEPIPLEEVEPAKEIVKRFSTGGMSLGALSPEAHETLAVAMNRIGGLSNSGEGGEDRSRNEPDPNGDLRRSRIRQVASGRFGVTIDYLAHADQIQIKMAQGAKPGEGGQLPGHKVDGYIAALRHATPGVELISPPPHHDIYSIEDLKQLIYDLRCTNPTAAVSVKLAAEVGVGTVAAGVAKANADHVVIAGHDGGTGASPLASIQAAGVPWELGLAETQQTLLRNELRSRITVQTDGGMRTGRDVVIAALLGADEVGFSTAPLIATGCIMMRVCHLNTCPVGVATQDPELRKRFAGKPEHVVNYLFLVAEETRKIMARLGVRTYEELIGRTELLEGDTAVEHFKARGIDLSELLTVPENAKEGPRHQVRGPDPVLDGAFDHRHLLHASRVAFDGEQKVKLSAEVTNRDRTVGTLLSSAIARLRGPEGLPEGSIEIHLNGSAGQSFAAWLAAGVTISLEGEANDYCGKGLSGGVLSIQPPKVSHLRAEDNVVVGNVALYGATSGRAFFNGLAGERFAIRNSGAEAVVEGVGDHGCEYMTGGRVVVLGPTGLNFAAGMSGGIAYVLDPDGQLPLHLNSDLVDLEPLEVEDRAALRVLLEEHKARTNSARATEVLKNWEEWLPQFVRVMPRDYKRVLEEGRTATQDLSTNEQLAVTPS